ncbi:hypothetical protein BJ973_009451 [Actinoplanes tereljensis]|uniref:Lipoprotein n=1 Tax=Paractinoplanes tereljensis TaxID=571912 RepID=A0A919TPY2_9ACTN|nr:hypothetical protein [Actinoplanes tereljensis]GIF17584.1 hypothetical protein Ate02nite_03140 [Actinoplanes tereljensis]
MIRLIVALSLLSAVSGCLNRKPEPVPPAPASEHVVAGALLGRTGGYLTVRDAASRVRVVLATLPGLLYRISTPADSGLTPQVSSANGRVGVSLRPAGGDGPDEVHIVLNREVRWQISLPAGAGEQQLDLRRGRISRLDLGASGLVELNLPAADGPVPITLGGGVGSAVVTAEAGTPLRVQLDQGAGAWPGGPASPPGTVWQTLGRPAASGRYAIRALAAIGTLTLRTRQKE